MALRATKGVKIPGRKATRAEIVRMFKDHLTKLKENSNVCRHFSPIASQLLLFNYLLEQFRERRHQYYL
jgi:hypothetical protein